MVFKFFSIKWPAEGHSGHLWKGIILAVSALISGCSPGFTPLDASETPVSYTQPALIVVTPAVTPTFLPASATFTATQTPDPSPVSTWISVPSQTILPSATPKPLSLFSSSVIRPGIAPSAYITDTCQYLALRWSSTGSPPGTVVIPVMFHGIRESGKPINDNVTISADDFHNFIQYARELGFETITTAQLAGFLYRNERIPARSLIMIVDDRRPGTVENHFLPILAEFRWTVTLGWISADVDESLWQRMEDLFATGLIDVQSHGYYHRYINAYLPEEQAHQEIYEPIKVLEDHFGQRPLAIVWPGGNFTPQVVQMARQAGYKLGFTANSRGPLLFNWIPLGEKEREVNDPLMVLPRGWSTALGVNLNIAVQVSDQARAEAVARYPEEAAYYRTYCGGELPALESVLPLTPVP